MDTDNLHNHFVLNSVNLKTGLKWQINKDELHNLKQLSNNLCKEVNIKIPIKKKERIKRNEYRAKERKRSYKYETFLTVKSIKKYATSKEDFINKMKEVGYDVKWTDERKYITFIDTKGKKVRNNKLYPNEDFTKESLEKVFKENKEKEDEYEREKKFLKFKKGFETLLFTLGSNKNRYPLSNVNTNTNTNQKEKSKEDIKNKNKEEEKGQGLF